MELTKGFVSSSSDSSWDWFESGNYSNTPVLFFLYSYPPIYEKAYQITLFFCSCHGLSFHIFHKYISLHIYFLPINIAFQ